MISAWDVYWVMQLDSIGGGLVFVGLICLLSGGFFSAVALEQQVYRVLWLTVPVLGLGVACFLGNIFLPSSKTAAAMYIVPRLTSGEAIEAMKPEARELYELAKDAIRELATDKKRKVEKE